MNCKLKISIYCEKRIKGRVNYIDGEACCEHCFWKQRKINKEKREDAKDKKI